MLAESLQATVFSGSHRFQENFNDMAIQAGLVLSNRINTAAISHCWHLIAERVEVVRVDHKRDFEFQVPLEDKPIRLDEKLERAVEGANRARCSTSSRYSQTGRSVHAGNLTGTWKFS